MFAYPCPSCSQRLLAPAERAGLKTVCPKCLNPLTVPHPDEAFGEPPFGPPVDGTEAFTPPPASAVETPTPANTALPEIDVPELDLSVADVRDTATAITLAPVRVEARPDDHADASALLSALADLPARRPVATAPPGASRSPHRERVGQVVLCPTGSSGRDAIAELSATISMRMAPPPEPATDRTVTFVCWVGGLLIGLVAWTGGVFLDATWLPHVALIGGAMAAFGWLWRAYLSGRSGNLLAAGATLLPPVCVVQLFRPIGQYGLRPLRFVATGLALLGLFAVGPAVHAKVGGAFGERSEPLQSEPVTAEELANQLGEKATREAARKGLVLLGADAEPAVLPLLGSANEATVLVACEVLEQIGGEKSLAALRKVADEAQTRAVRVEAASAANAIAKRVPAVK